MSRTGAAHGEHARADLRGRVWLLDRPAWQHGTDSRIWASLFGAHVGVRHVAGHRPDPDDTRRWRHYLGAFTELDLAARDADALH